VKAAPGAVSAPADATPGAVSAPASLCVTSALATAALSLVGTTGPEVREVFATGTEALAAIFVAQTAGTFVGSALVGPLPDRWLQPLPAGGLTAAALLVAAAAPSVWILGAAMAVSGLGAFLLVTAAQAEVARRSPGARARALSAFHVWGGAGALVAPLAFSAVLGLGVSWRIAFVLIAGAFAVYAVWGAARVALQPGARVPSARRPRITRRARWALAVPVLGVGLQLTLGLYLASLLVDDFGASSAAGSAVVGLYALGLLVARVTVSRLGARTEGPAPLRVSAAVLLVAYAGFALSPSAWTTGLAAVALGVGIGPLLPLGMARVAAELEDDRAASALVFALNAVSQVAVPAFVVLLGLAVDLHLALTATAGIAVVVAFAVRSSETTADRAPATAA